MDAMKLIEEAERLSEHASPGPWRVGTVHATVEVWAAYPQGPGGLAGERMLLRVNPNFTSAMDTSFIARARTLVPDLAAALRESEERNKATTISLRCAEASLKSATAEAEQEGAERKEVAEFARKIGRERDELATANLAANKRIVALEHERDAARAELAQPSVCPRCAAPLRRLDRMDSPGRAAYELDKARRDAAGQNKRAQKLERAAADLGERVRQLEGEVRDLRAGEHAWSQRAAEHEAEKLNARADAETWMRRAQGWESEAAIATERFNRLAAAQPGEPLDMDCGDNSCLFAKTRGGMRTNGGCRCLESLGFSRGQTDSLRRMAAEVVSLRKRMSDLTTPRPIAEAPRKAGAQIIALWMHEDVVESMDVVCWADMDDGDHPERKFWMNTAGEVVEHMTHFLPLPEVKP